MQPTNFQIHVDIDTASQEEYGELTGWWLDSLLASFVGKAGFDTDWDPRLNGGWGYYHDSGPTLAGDYGPDVRRRFSEVLLAGPGDASFDVYGTDQTGAAYVWVKLRCWTLPREPTKAQVWAEVALSSEAAVEEVDQVESMVVELLMRSLLRWEPLFAGISDDFTSNSVALDKAQKVNGHVARRESGTFLRSYSWVTYCPRQLLESLPESLEGSGAFGELTELPSGVLLRATEHLRDFEGSAVRAVRDALAPLLRPKSARRVHLATRHLRVAWDDGTNGPFAPPPTAEEVAEIAESGMPWRPTSLE